MHFPDLVLESLDLTKMTTTIGLIASTRALASWVGRAIAERATEPDEVSASEPEYVLNVLQVSGIPMAALHSWELSCDLSDQLAFKKDGHLLDEAAQSSRFTRIPTGFRRQPQAATPVR